MVSKIELAPKKVQQKVHQKKYNIEVHLYDPSHCSTILFFSLYFFKLFYFWLKSSNYAHSFQHRQERERKIISGPYVVQVISLWGKKKKGINKLMDSIVFQ